MVFKKEKIVIVNQPVKRVRNSVKRALRDWAKRDEGNLEEQVWHSSESTRLLSMWRKFDSRRWHHMWVEFVVSSCRCSVGFTPGSPVFSPLCTKTLPNPISTRKQWMKSHTVDVPLKFLFVLFVTLEFLIAHSVILQASEIFSCNIPVLPAHARKVITLPGSRTY